MGEDDQRRRLAELEQRVAADNEARREAWWPSASSIEAFALKVLGAWELLKSDVNWAFFHAVGREGPPAKSDKLPATIRRVAEIYNIRWPHEEWSAACLQAGDVRHRLAHLLYVTKVDNDSPPPNRAMAFMRLGKPGEPRKRNKRPGELSFRDDVWSQQYSRLDAVSEHDLVQALKQIQWLDESCRYLQRFGEFLNGDDPWPDDYVVPSWERDLVRWWFDDWGEPETTELRAGQLRAVPLTQH
ncbi:hypothetical protein MGALJ_09950 [Mycobacterium gallinarum]|uniref:Uncharacterized protein n=1 Tax=Mycobacterium gallinarum TaxID=39689 RepID=A0A9W4AZK6_9MYCO|nr:hypothetical protein [Mycobacterium gallinarum]BBY91326.1 hypothetical protein MGALJ_09950 [Mycobacterium gallinarum]